jgi:hypothetical protein
MCCGINKKKSTKPNGLSSTKKKVTQSGFTATKKSYKNGKRNS